MDSKTYEKIRAYCSNFLMKGHHDRHLEDLVQTVAMKYFESGMRGSWSWYCCDYTRENGLNQNKKSKQTARTLELGLSIDAPGPGEDSENSHYLLDQESISRSDHEDQLNSQEDNFKGALEEFLSPLKLSSEVFIWITENYKVKTS